MLAKWDWKAVPQELNEHLEVTQAEVVDRLRAGERIRAIAESRGCSERRMFMALARIKARLIGAGYDPERGATVTVPPSQKMAGRSTYVKVDPDSGEEKVIGYWNKGRDTEKEALSKFAETLIESIKPYKPRPAPKSIRHNPDLMSGVFIGDAHIGLYAYAPETGHSDFDSTIASSQLREALDNLISRSPDSEVGLLVNVGDFIHANGSNSKTFAGTELDTDTRHERVLDVAAAVMAYAIDRMLEKFARVVVVNAKGNHDQDSSVAIQKIMAAYYRNEPRVNILRTAGFTHYIEWGKWLIGINHGDKIRAKSLPGIMARDMAEAWGRTKSRMWALGHFHHQEVLELDGCTVQKFGALPPPDGWHAGQGYSSQQAMQMIIFKKQGGRHSTMIYEIERPARQPDITI